MAMTRQEMLNDVLVSVAKDQKRKEEIRAVLKAGGIDTDDHARNCFALLELAVEGFRKHGISPCMLAPLLHLKAHGATSDRTLKMLMSLQDDEELLGEATTKATVM